MWLEWAEHWAGRHHVIGYGIARSHLGSLKESCCPFYAGFASHPENLFLPTLPWGVILSLLASLHTHTHTHVGTSFTGGEKARMDIFP